MGMGKKTVNIILMVVMAFVVAACGTGKANVVRTSAKGLVRSMKPQEIADTADYNTKLRLRYFYEEAAKQQAQEYIAEIEKRTERLKMNNDFKG